MKCPEAVLTASKSAKISAKQKTAVASAVANKNSHPLLWKAIEHIIAHKYQREMGVVIGAGFDWSTILEWLVANLPAIIKLLLLLFGV